MSKGKKKEKNEKIETKPEDLTEVQRQFFKTAGEEEEIETEEMDRILGDEWKNRINELAVEGLKPYEEKEVDDEKVIRLATSWKKWYKENKDEFGDVFDITLTRERKEAVEKFLREENILKVIADITGWDDEIGVAKVVGERLPRQLAYLSLLSTVLYDVPLHVQISGESSGGKSHMVKNAILPLFHDEQIVELGSMSDRFLDYLAEKDDFFENKILYIPETKNLEDAHIHTLRILLSGDLEGRGTVETNENSESTARFIDVTAGTPSMLTTTAVSIGTNEYSNRLVLIGVDESDKQSEKIVDADARRTAEPWKYKEDEKIKEREEIIRDIPVYLMNNMNIDPDHVAIPFIDDIYAMLKKKINVRRNKNKMKHLVKIHALLNKDDRTIIHRGGEEYLIADIEDYIAVVLMFKDIKLMLEEGLNQTPRFVFKQICDSVDELPNPFKVNDVAGKIVNKSPQIVRKSLGILMGKGLIKQTEGSMGRGKTNEYKLPHYSEDSGFFNLTPILNKIKEYVDYDFPLTFEDLYGNLYTIMSHSDSYTMEIQGNKGDVKQIFRVGSEEDENQFNDVGTREAFEREEEDVEIGDIKENKSGYCEFKNHPADCKKEIYNGKMWMTVCEAHLDEAKEEFSDAEED